MSRRRCHPTLPGSINEGVGKDVEDAVAGAGVAAEQLAMLLILSLVILMLFPCVLGFIDLLSSERHL